MSSPAPKNGFHELLVEQAGFVRRLAGRLVNDSHDADDVAQATLLNALEHRPRSMPAVRAWLRSITRNLTLSSLRSGIRRRRREEACARPEATAQDWEGPAREDLVRRLVDAVFALPEPSRSIVLLRYYDELTSLEIAARLGIPAATVRTRLRRALERIRAQIEDGPDGGRTDLRPALLALAGPGAAVGGAAGKLWLVGSVIMTKKSAGLLALVLVLVSALIGVWRFGMSEASSAGGAARASSAGDHARGGADEPSAVAPTPAPTLLHPRPFTGREASDAVPGEVSVRGRVVDSGRQPIADARISWRLERRRWGDAESGPESPLRDVVSLADGSFTLTAVPPDAELWVRARPRERGDVRRLLVTPGGGVVDLGDLVSVAGGRIAGFVRDDQGEPLIGVRVAAAAVTRDVSRRFIGPTTPDFSDARETVTAADGSFAIGALAAGEYAVLAAVLGRVGATRDGVLVKEGALTADVMIRLPRGARLQGRVVSPGGLPIGGALVTVVAPPIAEDGEQRLADTITVPAGPDGHFAIDGLAPGGHALTVWAPGYVGITKRGITPGVDEQRFELSTARAVPFVVTVAGQAEVPADLRIRVFGATSADQPPRVLDGAAAAAAAGVDVVAGLHAVIDAPGKTIDLRLAAPGHAVTRAALPAEERATPVAIALLPEVIVSGFVRDPRGEPVAGARVQAAAADDGEAGPPVAAANDARAVANPDGSFRLRGLGPGRVRLRAEDAQSTPSGEVVLELDPATPVPDVELRLCAAGRIAGQVWTSRGEPLPGARVALRRLADPADSAPAAIPRPAPTRRAALGTRAVTDAGGRFEIGGVEAGRYAVRIVDESEMRSRVVISGGDAESLQPGEVLAMVTVGQTSKVELHAVAPGRIHGTVSASSGPAPGIEVVLTSGRLIGSTVRTASDGTYAFAQIEPGRYEVAVVLPAGAAVPAHAVDIAADADVAADFMLPGGEIFGRVVAGADRHAVAGASVVVTRTDGGAARAAVSPERIRAVASGGVTIESGVAGRSAARTDAEGRFRVRWIDDGTYCVAAEATGFAPARQDAVLVRNGRTEEVLVVLEAGGGLEVTVDAPGVDAVLVQLTPPAGMPRVPLRHGVPGQPIVFGRLAPGTYSVRAQDLLNKLTATVTVDVPRGGTARLDLTLKRSQ